MYRPSIDLGYHEPFWLRSLVVAALVERLGICRDGIGWDRLGTRQFNILDFHVRSQPTHPQKATTSLILARVGQALNFRADDLYDLYAA